MLAALTREFVLPRRLLIAIPVIAALWAASDAWTILSLEAPALQFMAPANVYWSLVTGAFAGKYLIAFGLIVILRRVRVSVLSGVLLLLALTGLATGLLGSLIGPMFTWSTRLIAAGLIGLAAATSGKGLIPFLLLVGVGPLLVAALVIATAVVLIARILAGEGVFGRSPLAMWGIHLVVASIAIVFTVGASSALH